MNDNVECFADQFGQSVLLWMRLLREIIREEGLTSADKRILYGLSRQDGLTKKQLATAIVLEHSSLTRSLDRLEQQGLLTRVVNNNDKRCVTLSLTPQGDEKVKQVRAKTTTLMAKLLSEVDSTDLQQATTVLQTFRQHMQDTLSQE